MFLVHVAAPMRVIVASSNGVLATTDGGRRWRDVTPRQWAREPFLVSHVADVASIGDRIWLAPVGEPAVGLHTIHRRRRVHLANRDIFRVENLFVAGSLSFWNTTDGRVLGEAIDGRTNIDKTANGGRSWTRPRGLGGQLTGAPIRFQTVPDRSGWSWNDRGVLTHTEDRGRTWKRVQLPGHKRLPGVRCSGPGGPPRMGVGANVPSER